MRPCRRKEVKGFAARLPLPRDRHAANRLPGCPTEELDRVTVEPARGFFQPQCMSPIAANRGTAVGTHRPYEGVAVLLLGSVGAILRVSFSWLC